MSPLLQKHFDNPQHVGTFTGSRHATAGSQRERCLITFYAKSKQNICFKCYGCAHSIATASYLAEYIHQGNDIPSAQQLIQTLDLPPTKHHCAIIALEALKGALFLPPRGQN